MWPKSPRISYLYLRMVIRVLCNPKARLFRLGGSAAAVIPVVVYHSILFNVVCPIKGDKFQ